MVLDSLPLPVVLAPLAGGPSTPELTAAVGDAGGFGFLAGGYLAPAELQRRIGTARALSPAPFGVNLFVPAHREPVDVQPYARELAADARRAGATLGEPRLDDDGWDAKVDLLCDAPVPVVSFTFGLPDRATVARLHDAGSEVWVTVGTPAEALAAQAAGGDVLVAQGSEAGGHRGGPGDEDAVGLLALLQLLPAVTPLPLVASGGIATAAAVRAVLTLGAHAAMAGTAFLRCPEAGTSAVHRQALADPAARPTALTRAFTGRTARGIRNAFLDAHTAAAPAAYPEVHHLTAPLRQVGRERPDPDLVNLWAGQAYPLSPELPAADVVRLLAGRD